MMRLGYFKKFKGLDAVLLSCEAEDVRFLSSRIAEFVQSPDAELPLHASVSVSSRYPARLFLCRANAGQGFRWLCSETDLPSIQPKLEALAATEAGHEYFELAGSTATLVVAVGEYDESWWRHYG